MLIEPELIAEKITEYLYHAMTLAELNAWAQSALTTGDFRGSDELMEQVKRLSGPLTWDDCGEVLRVLGYGIRVDVFQVDTRMQSGRMRAVPTTHRVAKQIGKPR